MFKLTEGYDVFTHLLSSLWSYSSTHISQGRSIVINRTIVAQSDLDIGNNNEILMLLRYTDKYTSLLAYLHGDLDVFHLIRFLDLINSHSTIQYSEGQ